MSPTATAPRSVTPWSDATVMAAATLPGLLAFNLPPSPTALNQALAFGLWGTWAAALAHEMRQRAPGPARSTVAMVSTLGALALLLALAAASGLSGALPPSLMLSTLATLLAAGLLGWAGAHAAAAAPAEARRVFAVFCTAWLLAGWLQALIAGIQVFAPQLADGGWVAASALPGRAVGNLRQPNHVCTMLLWGLVGTAALLQLGALSRRAAALTVAVLAWALVLTASRTAILGVVALAAWGLLDRRLLPATRLALIASAAAYALAWFGMSAWAASAHQPFGAAARFAGGDVSASRFGIWRDTLALIARHPWTGVGFGEFNFAWSLEAFPQRPRAFFDHTHNLFLQWAVELGLPAALLLSMALLATLVPMLRAAWRRTPAEDHGVPLRFGLALLAAVGLHSLLEYPLWYAYFLLPTAWVFGLLLGLGARVSPGTAAAQGRVPPTLREPQAAAAAAGARSPVRTGAPLLMAGGLAMLLAAAALVADYARVAAVFNEDSVRPLAARLDDGKRSIFFTHHAHYAVATTSDDPREVLASASIAAHYLLDTRLMIAWADAWAATGDEARARHLAARLREFANPQATAYFSVCADGSARPPAPDAPVPLASTAEPAAPAAPAAPEQPLARPYQCEPATQAPALGWRDFARPSAPR